MKGKNQGNDPENLPKINPIWGKPALHVSIATRCTLQLPPAPLFFSTHQSKHPPITKNVPFPPNSVA